MASQENGKDESSIGSVSSLLSRFEKIKTDGPSAPPSNAPARSPYLPPASGTPISRPGTPLRPGRLLDRTVVEREGSAPGGSRPRPPSVLATSPTRAAPPLVTVDSPHSADRKQTFPFDTRSATPAPHTQADARPPSRSTTPSGETRVAAALAQGLNVAKAASDGVNTAPTTPVIRPKAQTSSVPPPVNRAAKPQIPPKPNKLVQKPEALSAPEANAEWADQGASPFSTPPGSGPNSPPPNAHFDADQNRKGSDPFLGEKARIPSDASSVERRRTNSATSPMERVRGESNASFINRARVGSNASFVEPSSLPDEFHHEYRPLVHATTVALPPAAQAHGMSRPARYRPIGSQDLTLAGDLPEQPPRLPVRPELQTRSGRTSPTKPRSGRTSPLKRVTQEAPGAGPRRAATIDVTASQPRIPATKKPAQRSALSLGFDQASNALLSSSPPTKAAHGPPAVPPPRRSMDSRRPESLGPPIEVQSRRSMDQRRPEPLGPPVDVQPRRSMDQRRIPSTTAAPISVVNHAPDRSNMAPTSSLDGSNGHTASPTDYPDSSQASRRPPTFKTRPWHIGTEFDTRIFAVCGDYVCTTGQRTKAWNLRTGGQLFDLEHHDLVKVTSLVFKPPGPDEEEGERLWLGTSTGDIRELDLSGGRLVKQHVGAHQRREVIRMFRYASELWTLDDGGDLNVWKPDHTGAPSLDSKSNTFRTPRGHTFSIALGRHLWIATGKDIRVFAPSVKSDAEFHVLASPLSQPGTAEIYSGTTISTNPGLVYFGHSDGKVSVYKRHDFTCTAVVTVSSYKLSSLTGVGDYLWAGFNTGMVYVYDTSTTPWKVKKDWPAHERQVCGIIAEKSSAWETDRLRVVTLGTDTLLKVWDGTLEEDWMASRMQEHDTEFCSFSEINVAVLTWNAGASKPTSLLQNKQDDNFFREYMTAHDPPDIFVFGFQELVDLEDKKLTAKTFIFKGNKKKDANEQEHMSHQYRAWRDHLTRCLDEHMPSSHTYTLLHTASLVGLFTCVFVKTPLRGRIRHVQSVDVKRGMGGIYGNKGALILRMVLDDSSLCFINCHLAAGQTQTMHRNNDIAAILEAEALPPYPLDASSASSSSSSSDSAAQHADVFPSGGDGSMILDHEICILNGDLNYRIDTMGRDTVVKHVASNNLWRLLERDQLLLSRRKNPAFRLRAFQESEIRFAPTYKYNVHSDDYDTSEKRRAPAWCDRILYRGVGKVRMEEYRRWEVRVSDHRPVSGRLRVRVKRVDATRRAHVAEVCRGEFEEVRARLVKAVELEYLTDVLGMSHTDARAALQTR